MRGGGGAAGIDRADFWAGKAQEILRCYLLAAALAGADMTRVMHWANDPDDPEPAAILDAHRHLAPHGWLPTLLTHLRASPNTRTGYFATVTSCVGFMDSPTVAEACRPGPGGAFNVEAFLRWRGTLYLVGGAGDKRLAPLLTALTEYVFDEAQRIAAAQPGGRLTPTLNFVLDEVANITPVPLDRWASDSRGWGITVGAVVQSLAQFATTWGRDRAEVIWENLPTKVVLPGVTNSEDLRALSYLAGQRWVQRTTRGHSEGADGRASYSTSRTPTLEPVVAGHTISSMPRWHAYVLGLGRHPAIVSYTPGYLRVAAEQRAVAYVAPARRGRAGAGPGGGAGRATAHDPRADPMTEPTPPPTTVPAASPQPAPPSNGSPPARPAAPALQAGRRGQPPPGPDAVRAGRGAARRPRRAPPRRRPAAHRPRRPVHGRRGQRRPARAGHPAGPRARRTGWPTSANASTPSPPRSPPAPTSGPGAGGRPEPDAAPVDWPSLSADDATAEWQALGDWVASVLGPFYELTRAQLPDCWPLHRPAVLELVWLRRMYVAAHRPDAAPSAAADWHTRWRREALANIAAAIPETWCRPGEHWVERFSRRPGPPPPRPTAPVRSRSTCLASDPDLSATRSGWVGRSPRRSTGAGLSECGQRQDIAWRRHREAAAAGGQASRHVAGRRRTGAPSWESPRCRRPCPGGVGEGPYHHPGGPTGARSARGEVRPCTATPTSTPPRCSTPTAAAARPATRGTCTSTPRSACRCSATPTPPTAWTASSTSCSASTPASPPAR